MQGQVELRCGALGGLHDLGCQPLDGLGPGAGVVGGLDLGLDGRRRGFGQGGEGLGVLRRGLACIRRRGGLGAGVGGGSLLGVA